ncbi:hypothetical protein [Pseudactinotalea sp.]|uniref:hypothetical protein n=1 Tax=Pseudactinotalea sp. TaxID=1926260 RepID=UPI003B39FEB4
MPTERRLRWATGAAALLLIAGFSGGCATDSDESPESSTAADPTTEPAADPTTEPTPSDDGGDEWHEIAFPGGTFSVPPTWEVQSYTVDGEELERGVHGLGLCVENENLVTGLAFVTWREGETDAAQVATDEVDRAVASFYGPRDPDINLKAPEETVDGAQVTASVRLGPGDNACEAREAILIVRTSPHADGSGTHVFLVLGEMGVEHSPAPSDVAEIADSLVV